MGGKRKQSNVGCNDVPDWGSTAMRRKDILQKTKKIRLE